MTANVFLKSIAKFSVSSWANFIISLLTVIITTRVFLPETYGMINLFNTASAVLVSISCLGFDSAFIRFYHEPPNGFCKESLMVQCMFIAFISLLIISAISLMFFNDNLAIAIFGINNDYIIMLLCVNTLSLVVLNRFLAQYYRLGNDPFNFTIQQITVQIFSKLFVVMSIYISDDITTVLFVNTVGILMIMIIYVYLRRNLIVNHINLKLKGFFEVSKLAIFFWPQTLLTSLSLFIIPWIISIRLNSYSVGVYASANFFVGAFSVLQSGFGNYWSAFMYAHYKDEKMTIRKVHEFVSLFIIVVFLIFVLAQNVVYILIGESFQSSREFFSVVLVDPLLLMLGETTSYGIMLAKKKL